MELKRKKNFKKLRQIASKRWKASQKSETRKKHIFWI